MNIRFVEMLIFCFLKINFRRILPKLPCDHGRNALRNTKMVSLTCQTAKRRIALLFSPGKDAGGQAEVASNLKLRSVTSRTSVPSFTPKLSSIFFDHDGTDLKTTGDETASGFIEGITAKLCSSTGPNGRLSSSTAPVFLTLKSKIRFASKEVLADVYNKLKSGKICDAKDAHLENLVTLFVEAAAMAGSTDSVSFFADLVKSGDVSAQSEEKFRLFTTFANRPKESALESMRSLLASGDGLNPSYLLAASGTAHQFCLSQCCHHNEAYNGLVNEIAKQVVGKCKASIDRDEETVKASVIGLQALGNLDHLTPKATEAIASCLEMSDRIKAHALQAFRRDPCQESLRSEARKLLVNTENPAHIRISAYLALSQCYQEQDSEALRLMLKSEESVQGIF